MDRIAKEKIVSDLTKKFDESNFFILTQDGHSPQESFPTLLSQLL